MKWWIQLKNYSPYVLFALAFLALLTGCAPELSSGNSELLKINYPVVRQYDDITLDAAAAELESNSCPTLSDMVVDYGVMRDEIRVLRGDVVDATR